MIRYIKNITNNSFGHLYGYIEDIENSEKYLLAFWERDIKDMVTLQIVPNHSMYTDSIDITKEEFDRYIIKEKLKV